MQLLALLIIHKPMIYFDLVYLINICIKYKKIIKRGQNLFHK